MAILQKFKLQGFKYIDTTAEGEDAEFTDSVHATVELTRDGTDAVVFLSESGIKTVMRTPEVRLLLELLTGFSAVPRRVIGPDHVPPEQPRQPSTREEQIKQLVRAEVLATLREQSKS